LPNPTISHIVVSLVFGGRARGKNKGEKGKREKGEKEKK
jgi:hypothetical protein